MAPWTVLHVQWPRSAHHNILEAKEKKKHDTTLVKFKLSSYFQTYILKYFSFVGFLPLLLRCSLVGYCIHVYTDDILKVTTKVSHTVSTRQESHTY